MNPTFEQFTKAVREMRSLQKQHFRTRNPETLNASKEAEKRVDKLLAEIDRTEKPSPQLSMFGGVA